jgi:glycosyltransferase involved in cell wall biosynthesis
MASAGSTDLLISVIMPVRNECRYLGSVLDDLLNQTFPREQFEVIIVDGESSDNTVALAESYRGRFPNLSIVSNPGRLASRARNIGVRQARGEYIVFIDGHCHIRSHTMLADMVDLFKRTNADILCRPQPLTMSPQTGFQKAVATARASRLGHALDSTIYSHRERPVRAASSGAMYRRSVFDRIGYFDESFDACEDVEFNTRADKAGLEAFISPKLAVEYVARGNIASLFKQLYRYGLGRWRLFSKHPGTLGAGALVTAAFTFCVLFYPLTWFLAGGLWMFATAVACCYLLIIFIVSILNIKSVGQSWLIFVLPAIFFVIHFALGYGFLSGVVRSRT